MKVTVERSYDSITSAGYVYADYARAELYDIPERFSDESVADAIFTPAPAPTYGDGLLKEFWKDSDGNTWMVKLESVAASSGEAAASKIFHILGAPAVPVYFVEINGQEGAWRPLVETRSLLPASPFDYNDDAIDGILRCYAGSLVTGLEKTPYDRLGLVGSTVVLLNMSNAFDVSPDGEGNPFGDALPAWDILAEHAKAHPLSTEAKSTVKNLAAALSEIDLGLYLNILDSYLDDVFDSVDEPTWLANLRKSNASDGDAREFFLAEMMQRQAEASGILEGKFL